MVARASFQSRRIEDRIKDAIRIIWTEIKKERKGNKTKKEEKRKKEVME